MRRHLHRGLERDGAGRAARKAPRHGGAGPGQGVDLAEAPTTGPRATPDAGRLASDDRRRRFHVVALDYGAQAEHPPPPRRRGLQGHGGAAGHAGRRDPRAQARRRVPLQRPRRSRRRWTTPIKRRARRSSARCRSSASASATSSSRSALGGKTYKLKFGHRGGNQPVKNLATGSVEITARTTASRSTRESLEGQGESSRTSTSTTTPSRASASRTPRLQRPVPPRGQPRARTTRATSSTLRAG